MCPFLADSGIGSTATETHGAASSSATGAAAKGPWRRPDTPLSQHSPGGQPQPASQILHRQGLAQQQPFGEGRGFGEAGRQAGVGPLPEGVGHRSSAPAHGSDAAAQGGGLPAPPEGPRGPAEWPRWPLLGERKVPSVSALDGGALNSLGPCKICQRSCLGVAGWASTEMIGSL